MTLFSARRVNLTAAFLCAVLLVFAYILQDFYHVMPCPLCLLQRFIYYGLLILFLLAGIQDPRSVGVRVYAFLTLLIGAIGIFLSGRQVYLQLSPSNLNAACLPGMSFMLKTMPLSKVITTMVKGSSECASVNWQFLHLSLAGWSLIGFVFFSLIALWLLCKPARKI